MAKEIKRNEVRGEIMDEQSKISFRGINIRYKIIDKNVYYCLRDIVESLGWSRSRLNEVITKFNHEKKYSGFGNKIK